MPVILTGMSHRDYSFEKHGREHFRGRDRGSELIILKRGFPPYGDVTFFLLETIFPMIDARRFEFLTNKRAANNKNISKHPSSSCFISKVSKYINVLRKRNISQ